jgi:hypothetical protein
LQEESTSASRAAEAKRVHEKEANSFEGWRQSKEEPIPRRQHTPSLNAVKELVEDDKQHLKDLLIEMQKRKIMSFVLIRFFITTALNILLPMFALLRVIHSFKHIPALQICYQLKGIVHMLE